MSWISLYLEQFENIQNLISQKMSHIMHSKYCTQEILRAQENYFQLLLSFRKSYDTDYLEIFPRT